MKKTSTHGRKFKPRYTYSLLDVIAASPTQPLPEPKRQFQLTRMYSGLAAIEKSANPTRDDWAVCSDAVNLMETLILYKEVADERGLIMDGITALAQAGRRAVAGGQIRLDGPGIAAMRAVLEDYVAVLEVLPARVIVNCHRQTERRIREILAGKRKPHDIEIITASAMQASATSY